MRVAYLDCQSGISGDMFLAACVDAGADFDLIQEGIRSLGTGNCELERKDVQKFGFRALKINVLTEPEHAHRHLHHIEKMIDESSISEAAKKLAKDIFLRLAVAEAKVHGSTLEKVHFHEVGAIDSIADIVGGAIAWEQLKIDRLVCGPIPTGRGQIKIAHGNVSIPAPATAELLKGLPIRNCDIEAELTTPTGAAIAASLVDEFGGMPPIRINEIGIGAGTKDLDEQANVLRLTVGEQAGHQKVDSVVQLDTNLDDVTAEVIGYCRDRLEKAGALDVWTTAIQMKKNRSGVMLSVLCRPDSVESLKEMIFLETGTLGIRQQVHERTILNREPTSVKTELGEVAGKQVTQPDGTVLFFPEYESCSQLAEASGRPIREIFDLAKSASKS